MVGRVDSLINKAFSDVADKPCAASSFDLPPAKSAYVERVLKQG